MSSKLKGKYKTTGAEGEFEPGSRNLVLKNLLGIKSKHEMEIIESKAYDYVTIKALESFGKDHALSVIDICKRIS